MTLQDNVLILDFGAQYTQLIARRVRENNVFSVVRPCVTSLDEVKAMNPKAIILSGGPASVHEHSSPKCDEAILKLGIPVLGICYGQQLLCQALGGKVEPSAAREFGRAMVSISKSSALTDKVWDKGTTHQAWMSHGDKVIALPEGFEVIATTDSTPFAIVADEKRKLYGVQFHPEVEHTVGGGKLIGNFLKAAGCKSDWNMASFHHRKIEEIRAQVGDSRVICGVSGGVDSTVVAKLIHEAIGDRLTCIFVDTGLLRFKEADEVVRMFGEDFHIPLDKVDASDIFLSRLDKVTDPERKRKIIGETFIEVFEKEANKFKDAGFLAQGTLYPDVIESVSFYGGPSATIKSHHNVGGLPERMNLKLVEPLRELFKDEVRALARELNIPEKMWKRHPFPGPGLAIRIPGEITREKIDILQKADAVYIEEIVKAGLYDKIWQAFAALLPVRTVGVMGDARTYEFALALRAVTSSDGMTADFYHFDHEFLGRVSNRIVNEVRGVNRVLYDVTSKPPGTIEWE